MKLPIQTPEMHISRYVSDGLLSADLHHPSLSYCQRIREKDPHFMAGRNPRGVSAALIYIDSIVSGHDVRQSDVGKITKVTEVTIRTRYLEIVELLDLPIEGGRIVVPQ